jgi:hypothetical protein
MLFFRDPGFFPGFADWFPQPTFITSGGISVLVALPLFMVPLEASGSVTTSDSGGAVGVGKEMEFIRDTKGDTNDTNDTIHDTREGSWGSDLRDRTSSSAGSAGGGEFRSRASSLRASQLGIDGEGTRLNPSVVGHREIAVLGVSEAEPVSVAKGVESDADAPTILDSTSVQEVNWGVILILGGGFVLAKGSECLMI